MTSVHRSPNMLRYVVLAVAGGYAQEFLQRPSVDETSLSASRHLLETQAKCCWGKSDDDVDCGNFPVSKEDHEHGLHGLCNSDWTTSCSSHNMCQPDQRRLSSHRRRRRSSSRRRRSGRRRRRSAESDEPVDVEMLPETDPSNGPSVGPGTDEDKEDDDDNDDKRRDDEEDDDDDEDDDEEEDDDDDKDDGEDEDDDDDDESKDDEDDEEDDDDKHEDDEDDDDDKDDDDDEDDDDDDKHKDDEDEDEDEEDDDDDKYKDDEYPVYEPAENARQIIFRLDDVQDHWPDWGKKDGGTSDEIIKVFLNAGVPLAIGVIGGENFGEDEDLVATVARAVHYGSEVFNHGDDYKTKFNEIDTDCAKTHILRGMLGADDKPLPYCYTSFVPHQNRWERSTLKALEELGYKAISANPDSKYALSYDIDGKVAKLPYYSQTATYDKSARADWESRIDDIIPNCKKRPEEEACVVMMHPMEFSDYKKDHIEVELEELEDLLEEIKSLGWKVTTFAEFLGVKDQCVEKKEKRKIKDEC